LKISKRLLSVMLLLPNVCIMEKKQRSLSYFWKDILVPALSQKFWLYLPRQLYTGESQLPGGEYTREYKLPGDFTQGSNDSLVMNTLRCLDYPQVNTGEYTGELITNTNNSEC
jgi:hypothetical protein